MIKFEKKHCNDINRKSAKILRLSSGKIDKYQHLTSKGMLHSDQSRIIEQAAFGFSPFAKAFKKQIKTTENQGEKAWKATA